VSPKALPLPSSATEMIAGRGCEKIHAHGYLYVLMRIALSAVIMLIIPLLIKNSQNQAISRILASA